MLRLLLPAVLFMSCHNIIKKDNRVISTEKLDTIKTVQPSKALPLFFERAFALGTQEQGKTLPVNFYGVTVGSLKVETGRIVACDPFLIEEYGKPFAQIFPTGEFPLQFSIANIGGEETIAFARINFSDTPVAKWEVALLPGEKPVAVNGKSEYGYVADAGIGVFMDEQAMKAISSQTPPQLNSILKKEMDKHYRLYWRYAMYNVGQHNIAAFTSGAGEGRYTSYIGYDAQGKPCRLLTDFGLIDWRNKEH